MIKKFINKGGSKDKVKTTEESVVDEGKEIYKKESFYELPTNEILKIVGKNDIEDVELLCEVISRTCESKREESILLLNVIKREEATIEECIKILLKFKYCPLCQRMNELFNENKDLVERDYEYEIEELKKEIEELKNKTFFSPATERPPDLENNICKAADKGKLTSIKYLFEQCHVNVETKDNFGCTPLNIASSNGQLEIVKYLYEICHADVETKDKFGCTPISLASSNGQLEVIKYLFEQCHADVETKDKNWRTPIYIASSNGHLKIVKYLYETCHANVETRDNYGNTPINRASQNGQLEVVKYLYETCHAKITKETQRLAHNKCEEYINYVLLSNSV